MSARTFVTFNATFPDDSSWDADGNLLVPGGKDILSVIQAHLRQRDVECTDVQQQEFYGWTFNAHYSGMLIKCVLQFVEPWLLTCEPVVSLLHRLLRQVNPVPITEFTKQIQELLGQDRRFGSTRWFTRQEFETMRTLGGHESPA